MPLVSDRREGLFLFFCPFGVVGEIGVSRLAPPEDRWKKGFPSTPIIAWPLARTPAAEERGWTLVISICREPPVTNLSLYIHFARLPRGMRRIRLRQARLGIDVSVKTRPPLEII